MAIEVTCIVCEINFYTLIYSRCDECRKTWGEYIKRSKQRPSIPKCIYTEIRKSGPCVYCGNKSECVDHIFPLARGGTEHIENLVPACLKCNTSKGDKLLTEWIPERMKHGAAHSYKIQAALAILKKVHPDRR